MKMASFLLTPTLLVALLAGVQAADVQQLRGEPAKPLNEAVITRSFDELAIATNANAQAKATAKAALSQQQNYASHVSIKAVMEDYDKVKALVPEARAATLKVRMYASRARQHAEHTVEVEKESRRIPEYAAERSKEAVEGWIAAEAAKVAEASAVSPAEAAKSKQDKIAAKVAAAAEPYHLALLRQQKFTAETYSKAKTAQQSSVKLQTKAREMALQAQQLQAGNLVVDAQEMMSQAHAVMNEAETLRQWATKLYNQADKAGKATGGYTASEQQAATAAAVSAVINPPMKLPAAAL